MLSCGKTEFNCLTVFQTYRYFEHLYFSVKNTIEIEASIANSVFYLDS